MDDLRAARLVETVLRCYPVRWRQRHGVEAAELAALLIRDGASVSSIAGSYLAGAAREWLAPRPGRRLSAAVGTLLVAACSLGITGALLATSPAGAATHPSRAPVPAYCRSDTLRPSPNMTSAGGRSQIVTAGTGHGRSC